MSVAGTVFVKEKKAEKVDNESPDADPEDQLRVVDLLDLVEPFQRLNGD